MMHVLKKTNRQRLLPLLLVGSMLCLFPAGALTAQQVTVAGRVTDAAGEALPFVNVVVKGATQAVLTNENGDYSIHVPGPETVLQFSFVGYVTQELPVGDRRTINIVLEEEVGLLDEIIVVAYGTQKKSSVTGSIATVKSEALATVTAPNVQSMLQGKVAGMQVLNTSGRPGDAPVIRIRGKSSLGSDASIEPLWVVDGVIMNMSMQLNPNDIDNISILKDATATALYGSRATNGVILVTTKGGKAGDNRIEASAKFGIATQHLGKFKLMNAAELYDYSIAMQGATESYPWLRDKDALLAHDTDWFDTATQTGTSHNYTVSHTLGTEGMRNFLSADMYRETGTVRGFTYERFSLRDNVDVKVNNRLTLHGKFAGSFRHDDNRQHSLYSAMTYLPWDYPYNPDGTVRTGKENGISTAEDWHGRDESNYLYNNQYDYEKSKTVNVSGTLGFDWKITDWLTFESNNNIEFRFRRHTLYSDPRSIGSEGTGGTIGNRTYLATTRYANQLIRFGKIFDGLHAVNAFLGYEFNDYLYEDTDASGQSIPAGGEVLNVSATPLATKGTKYGNAMQSYYFNANYTYDDKYNAQFSFRRDGSSKFGREKRYGNFWTAGAAWSVDKEAFMKNVPAIDFLKLRVSYGMIGNSSSLGNYSYLSVYGLTTHYAGTPASFPNVLGNPDLSWETCYETNIAIDTRILNRFNLTVDYYIKNTSGLIYSRKLSSLTGYNSRYENIGAVRNNGIEITFDADIIHRAGWLWRAGFNVGYNKNKITELANNNADQLPSDTSNKLFRVGEDRDTFYLPEWAGVDVYTGAPLWYAYDENGARRIVTDVAQASRVLAGSSNPNFFGGIQTSLSYRGITLSATGSFVTGNKIYHAARQFYDNDGAYPTYNGMSLSSNKSWVRWERPGDIATHPQAISGGNNLSNEPSTRFLEDGSYFRLTNVSLSYDIPAGLLKKIGLRYAQLYVSGENLFTLTKFSGADVEVGAGNSNGNYNTDLYPLVRRVSVGLNFNF
ncbi:MAG: TonB-dependent receptor [Prevotellaceae bacterium]|jgi:TonB-linked SusC/RagA family outer membrane protein|nr:TonB-dependent receptor [Prevotellaceae bacterium]